MHVGHDGSMVRLAAGLGLGRANGLRWPAMSSEIVMEVNSVFPILTSCIHPGLTGGGYKVTVGCD
ncbi:hypothetical protein BKA82DRAFT_4240389 [Pisolithus tinctorius]|nr:hypothetical protein BKA82DRAFT_4240389 [Pisolithus tinctorius]